MLRQLETFLQDLNHGTHELRGSLHLGVIPVLNVPLVPELLGVFSAAHPAVSLVVEEISSTEIETALEEGKMDVGLGFLTRHSPNLRYERLCSDEFALIVPQSHPWAKRRTVNFTDLHQQRLLQLTDSFVMRRMTDEICRKHQVRPRTVAEINSIETLLRSLAPLQAAALMPKIALRGRDGLSVKAIRLQGKGLAVEIGLLRLRGSAGNTRSRPSPKSPARRSRRWSRKFVRHNEPANSMKSKHHRRPRRSPSAFLFAQAPADHTSNINSISPPRFNGRKDRLRCRLARSSRPGR